MVDDRDRVERGELDAEQQRHGHVEVALAGCEPRHGGGRQDDEGGRDELSARHLREMDEPRRPDADDAEGEQQGAGDDLDLVDARVDVDLGHGEPREGEEGDAGGRLELPASGGAEKFLSGGKTAAICVADTVASTAPGRARPGP